MAECPYPKSSGNKSQLEIEKETQNDNENKYSFNKLSKVSIIIDDISLPIPKSTESGSKLPIPTQDLSCRPKQRSPVPPRKSEERPDDFATKRQDKILSFANENEYLPTETELYDNRILNSFEDENEVSNLYTSTESIGRKIADEINLTLKAKYNFEPEYKVPPIAIMSSSLPSQPVPPLTIPPFNVGERSPLINRSKKLIKQFSDSEVDDMHHTTLMQLNRNPMIRQQTIDSCPHHDDFWIPSSPKETILHSSTSSSDGITISLTSDEIICDCSDDDSEYSSTSSDDSDSQISPNQSLVHLNNKLNQRRLNSPCGEFTNPPDLTVEGSPYLETDSELLQPPKSPPSRRGSIVTCDTKEASLKPQVEPVKIVVLGDDGVGKTALIVRLVTGRFIGDYDPSLEAVYSYVLPGHETTQVQIMDTAGQKGDSVNQLKWAEANIIVYSMTSQKSLEVAATILKSISQATEGVHKKTKAEEENADGNGNDQSNEKYRPMEEASQQQDVEVSVKGIMQGSDIGKTCAAGTETTSLSFESAKNEMRIVNSSEESADSKRLQNNLANETEVDDCSNDQIKSMNPTLLLGNKMDLLHQRQVSSSDGEELANRYECLFREIAASSTWNDVSEPFYELYNKVIDQRKLKKLA